MVFSSLRRKIVCWKREAVSNGVGILEVVTIQAEITQQKNQNAIIIRLRTEINFCYSEYTTGILLSFTTMTVIYTNLIRFFIKKCK